MLAISMVAALALAPPASAQSSGSSAEAPHRELPNVQYPKLGVTQPWLRSTTFVDYFGDNYNQNTNDDDFVSVVNYVNMGTISRMKRWTLSASTRVDTQTLVNTKSQALCDFDDDGTVTSLEASSCAYEDDYRLERLTLTADTKYLKITGGDFQASFGRGLGLSVRKISELGIDSTIKGGRVDLKTKPVDITGVGGVGNRQQSDFATRRLYTDPGYPHALCEQTPGLADDRWGNRLWTSCSDIVTGGRVESKLPGKVRLGTHYVFLWFGELTGGEHEALHLVGGDIARARIAKRWTTFLGASGIMRNYHHREYHPELVEDGVAVYGSNRIDLKDTTILVEGKYYDDYVVAKDTAPLTVQYAEPATLEREDQQVPAAANSAGGRLRVDYTFAKHNLTIYANMLSYAYAIANEVDMFDPDEGSMLYHAYAGIMWRDLKRESTVQASGGYRWEGLQSQPDPDTDKYTRKLPHAEVYVVQGVGHAGGFGHSVSLRADWRREEVLENARAFHFHKGNVILGYGMAPYLTFALIGGYSSEFPNLKDEPRLHEQPCPGGEDDPACVRKPHYYPGGEVRFNFTTGSFLRIFGGRQVGGILCVNGSCRLLPDFEGVRADLVLGF